MAAGRAPDLQVAVSSSDEIRVGYEAQALILAAVEVEGDADASADESKVFTYCSGHVTTCTYICILINFILFFLSAKCSNINFTIFIMFMLKIKEIIYFNFISVDHILSNKIKIDQQLNY